MCAQGEEHHCGRHNHADCTCESHQDKFIDAAMMLLIAQHPGHGYDMVERLKGYGFEEVDSTRVYRRLRRLEADGFLSSDWVSETSGPARRAYSITREGTDFLLAWKPRAERTLQGYRAFIKDLEGLYATK